MRPRRVRGFQILDIDKFFAKGAPYVVTNFK